MPELKPEQREQLPPPLLADIAAGAAFLCGPPGWIILGLCAIAAVAVFGAATIAFGFSRSLWLAVAALAVTGAADMVSGIVRRGVVQLGTPNPMRCQVNAVQGVFVVASNELGAFESGTLAALVGPVASVVAGGALTLVVAAAWYVLFPALRRADAVVPSGAIAEPSEAAALPL